MIGFVSLMVLNTVLGFYILKQRNEIIQLKALLEEE